MLAAITVDYGVPILYSRNSQETASILQIIAKREKQETPRDFALHTTKPMTLKELQEYIVASFPTKTISGKKMNYPRRGWIEKMLKRIGYEFSIIKENN